MQDLRITLIVSRLESYFLNTSEVFKDEKCFIDICYRQGIFLSSSMHFFLQESAQQRFSYENQTVEADYINLWTELARNFPM